MSLRIGSLAFVLLMVILSSSVVSGQTQGMAIIANNPKAVGIGPFALGHVAFAYQNPSDGLFIFGSMEPTPTSPIAPSDTTSLNTKKEYTFDELKTFLANNGYISYKAFYVDTPHVDAATAVENGLATKIYNVAASVTPPINNENCLTAAIKVLSAYGASLPDTNLLTITPNAYYLTTPGKMYYPDFMGDDPVVPTSYQKPTEEFAVAGESGNQAGTVSNQPSSSSTAGLPTTWTASDGTTHTINWWTADQGESVDSAGNRILLSYDAATGQVKVIGNKSIGDQSETGESGNQAGTVSNQPSSSSTAGLPTTWTASDGTTHTINWWTADQGESVDSAGNRILLSYDAATGQVKVIGNKSIGDQSETGESGNQVGTVSNQPRSGSIDKTLDLRSNDFSTTPLIFQQHPELSNQPTPVTLTLYFHNGDLNGPVIQGVEVTGQDGSGSNFQQTTDSRGSVIISGNPGTWSFSATAFGYQTKSWSQSISDTSDSHEYLQQVQQQESVATTTQQGSESSDVGKWAFHVEGECPGPDRSPATWDFVIDINNDGTFTGTYTGTGTGTISGKWVQSGDTIRFQQDPKPEIDSGSSKEWQSDGDAYEGTINGDTMSGTGSEIWHQSVLESVDYVPIQDYTCPSHWSASRVGTGDSGNQ